MRAPLLPSPSVPLTRRTAPTGWLVGLLVVLMLMPVAARAQTVPADTTGLSPLELEELRAARAAADTTVALPDSADAGGGVLGGIKGWAGQRYHNFVSYYNSFYNARKAYTSAVKRIEQEKSRKSALATVSARGFATATDDAQYTTLSKADLDLVIEKGTGILRFHPTSKWADDALLLMGKAYYYEGNQEAAERKFRELSANYPKSNLINEASLWYARTLIQQRRYPEAKAQLTRLLIVPRVSKPVLAGVHQSLGDLALRQDEADAAIQEYEQVIQLGGDDAVLARLQFQIAQYLAQLGRRTEAAEAFDRVHRFDSEYTLSYRARLNRARLLRELGRTRPALDLFGKLYGDEKNIDFRGEILLEMGITYASMGQQDAAERAYDDVIERYPKSEGSAQAYAQQGFRAYGDRRYDIALERFESSQRELPTSTVKDTVAFYVTQLRRYAELTRTVVRQDSAYAVALDRIARGDTLGTTRPVAQTATSADDSTVATATAGGTDADPTATEAQAVNSLFGDALADDEARGSSAAERRQIVARSQPRAGDIGRPGFTSGGTSVRAVGGLPRGGRLGRNADDDDGDSSAPTATAAVVIRTDAASVAGYRRAANEAQIALANQFHVQLGQPDSALVRYETLLARQPDSTLAAQALYAMIDLYRTTGKPDRADSSQRVLLETYPGSIYAQGVRSRIGGNRATDADEQAARSRYGRAIQQLNDGNAPAARQTLVALIGDPSAGDVAPQAMYALGSLYETRLGKPDSALAVYDRLMKLAPQSDYARAVAPRVTFALAERAPKDSTATGPAPVSPTPDSTATDSSSTSGPEFFTVVEDMPTPVDMPQPYYPQAAKRARIQGRVFVSAFVNEQGNVVDAKVVRDIGGGCGEAAVAAVRRWTFTPGKQRGRAVKVQITLPVVFKLPRPGDNARTAPARSPEE